MKQSTKLRLIVCTLIYATIFITGLVFMVLFFIELYKSKTYSTHQCEVQETGVKLIKKKYFPHWKVKMVDDDQGRSAFWFTGKYGTSKSDASENAERYKINTIYPCYGPPKSKGQSILKWNWQWGDPFESENYDKLVIGIICLISSVGSFILMVFYEPKRSKTRQDEDEEQQQQQMETPLRSEDNHESTA